MNVAIENYAVIAQRYRDILAAIIADQGGADRVSEARLQLVRRFAAAAVLAEQIEARLVRGDEIDVTEHALLSSTLARIARQIGIDRIPRDTEVPTLAAIIAEEG